jgi:hypothetical protein
MNIDHFNFWNRNRPSLSVKTILELGLKNLYISQRFKSDALTTLSTVPSPEIFSSLQERKEIVGTNLVLDIYFHYFNIKI